MYKIFLALVALASYNVAFARDGAGGTGYVVKVESLSATGSGAQQTCRVEMDQTTDADGQGWPETGPCTDNLRRQLATLVGKVFSCEEPLVTFTVHSVSLQYIAGIPGRCKRLK
jgi:hypothetical protein